MKRSFYSTIVLLLMAAFSFAQTTTTKMTKEGKPDMRVKANKEAVKVTKTTEVKKATATKSTGVNKDGTPDMRMKANKVKKVEAPVVTKASAPVSKTTTVTSVPATKTVTTTTKSSNTSTSSTDKVVGTDAKGRTIYEGPRGGHYYINKNGNKEYVKK